MKFYLLLSSALVSLFAFGPMHATSHPPVSVFISSKFLDGRHVTFACLTHQQSSTESLGLNTAKHAFVSWKVDRYNGDTVKKCHMIWKRQDGTQVETMFEAFAGAQIDRSPSRTDPGTQQVTYDWVVNERGLWLYNFERMAYELKKEEPSLHYIEVAVTNFLGHPHEITILCVSNQAHIQGYLIAFRKIPHGAGITWTIRDFDKDTDQSCRVDINPGDRTLAFQAFVGSWTHDNSIWNHISGQRRYQWVFRPSGLYRLDFHARQEMFVSKYPWD